MGYGLIDNTPMYYGAAWITPKFIQLIQSRIAATEPLPPNKDVTLVKSGVGNVFEELAEYDNTRIFAGETVRKVYKYVSPWSGKTKYILKSRRKYNNWNGRKYWFRAKRLTLWTLSSLPLTSVSLPTCSGKAMH